MRKLLSGAARCAFAGALLCAPLITPAFASASAAPVIDSMKLARLTPTDATITAKINGGGLETAYTLEVVAGCPEHFGRGVSCEYPGQVLAVGGELPASSVPQRVHFRMRYWGFKLSSGLEYTYSLSATNALGSANAPSQDFEAPFPGLPAIYSESALDVTATTATISASIDPEGSEAEYEFWFWPGCSDGGCERAPPHIVGTGHIGAVTKPVTVSAMLSGVPPGVSNNGYWVVATNAHGTSEGILQTFASPALAAGHA